MHSSCWVSHFTFIANHFFLFCHFHKADFLGSTQVKTDVSLFLPHSGSSLSSGPVCVCHQSCSRIFHKNQAQLDSMTCLEWHSTVWVRRIIYCFRGCLSSLPCGCTANMLWGECSFSNKTSKYVYFQKELDKMKPWELCRLHPVWG